MVWPIYYGMGAYKPMELRLPYVFIGTVSRHIFIAKQKDGVDIWDTLNNSYPDK
ncbi:hypothetical protein [Ferruginibacter albus]|uniref:hypothetical protein n=1 Tax=Ferruginibacter albus TaxID=2875540 RepID=UPI001CC6D28C|nr:hypothetical protein [Ferruginibacter albus]UAY53563.1 hypothetical protein K9M53_07825 [Ferruginibacter albus]